MISHGQIIDMIRTIGYYYDEINSYDEWIVFNYDCGHLEFDSWQDVWEWLSEAWD